MAGGAQPAFRLKGTLKQGRKIFDIGAAWQNEKGIGFNFRLAKDVEVFIAGVKVTDGPTGDVWLNLYDNRPRADEQDPDTGAVTPRASRSFPSAKHTGTPEKAPDDDIPF